MFGRQPIVKSDMQTRCFRLNLLSFAMEITMLVFRRSKKAHELTAESQCADDQRCSRPISVESFVSRTTIGQQMVADLYSYVHDDGSNMDSGSP
jgi:hypothetical protein